MAKKKDVIEEIKSRSSGWLKTRTTKELLSDLDKLEKYVLSDIAGKLDWDMEKVSKEDDDLADTIWRIRDTLRERFGSATIFDQEQTMKTLDDLWDRCKGMQKAIDDLKRHRHTETGSEPVRPF